MKITYKQRALAAMFGAALVALPTSGALADSTAEEIRLLKAKLRQLEQRLNAQEREEHAGRRGPRGSNALVVKGEPGPELAPDRFYIKGVSIKPGGFLALESVWRDRWVGADVNTPFQNIPFRGCAVGPLGTCAGNLNGIAGHANEFRFSARQSRVSMLAEGNVNPQTHLAGYIELDFLGAAQTANSNESNSYTPRIRQVLTNVDWNEWGLHLLAGQSWSLATLYAQSDKWDAFVTPPTIDAQYVPGFIWARQPGIRVSKDLPYNFTLAFSAESPATTFAGGGAVAGFPAVPGVAVTTIPALVGFAPVTAAFPPGGSLFNAANAVSLNRMPDLLGKATWDPTFFDRHIHLEAGGVLRDITDRALWGNHSVWAGFFNGGAIIPLWPKLLDLQVSGAVGNGIGRYGAGQLSDATLSVSGGPEAIHERTLLIGLTAHATPQTDVYVFAGGEFLSANWSAARFGKGAIALFGLGSPFFDNNGCDIENPIFAGAAAGPLAVATTCSGQSKAIRQITTGVWHTIYAGDFGKLKAGAQYSYTERDVFPGIGSTPKATESQFLTSFRYYPF